MMVQRRCESLILKNVSEDVQLAKSLVPTDFDEYMPIKSIELACCAWDVGGVFEEHQIMLDMFNLYSIGCWCNEQI